MRYVLHDCLRAEGIHIRQSPNVANTVCNTSHPYQADSCTGQSITQANTSATTGYILYACQKILIMGQQLGHSGYVQLQ